jgi:predicted glycosyltransferase involved in capsule biosynthesis
MNLSPTADHAFYRADTLAPPQLSVIIPFRDEGRASWFLSRIEELCASVPVTESIEFIVVDSGSIPSAREACRAICARHGVTYLFHDSVGATFSPGKARDFGVRHARGRAVTFLDVDLRTAEDFWPRLLAFMTVYGISEYKKRFFVVPALYLTDEGTQEYHALDPRTRFQDLYLRWLHGDQQSVQNMAPCTSIIVLDRLHYLSVGGHNPVFQGHGFEDFELLHRLAEEDGRYPRPHGYYKDTKTWDTATYNGFRSRLALFGRPALLSNLFVIHLWHPRPKSLSFYDSGQMKAARAIGPEIFKDFDAARDHPTPLVPISLSGRRVLVLGQPQTNITRCMRDAIPLLGDPIYIKETEIVDLEQGFDPATMQSLIENHRINLVLFNSPYANPEREALYAWCRDTRFPFLVFERGALPESWFFDRNGFNADSSSYARSRWDYPISDDARTAAADYIQKTITGNEVLESQGLRIGGQALAEKLRVGGRKVLFVPLQRPSDTVIRHMAGPAQSAEAFLAAIDEAAGLLKRAGWIVLCKKHPLEVESPPLQHAEYVPADTNFVDLLDLADAVALINSGVGLYAMMMGKPCHIFGQAFYAFDGVNRRTDDLSAPAIRDAILAGHDVDEETALRFVHYLRQEFYSFGTPKTLSRSEPDGSLRTLTSAIDFFELQLPGQPRVVYRKETWPKLALSAPVFERYKLDIFQKRTAAAPAAAPVRKTQTGAARTGWALRKAKLNKLRRSPHVFFRDSRSSLIRPFRHLFSPPGC